MVEQATSAVEELPGRAEDLHLTVFAREEVRDAGGDVLTFTADDLYRE